MDDDATNDKYIFRYRVYMIFIFLVIFNKEVMTTPVKKPKPISYYKTFIEVYILYKVLIILIKYDVAMYIYYI